MEPTQYRRVTDLLRGAGYILSLLLSLVPTLEKLLKNWEPGSNPSDIQDEETKSGQVNPGKEITDER